MKTDEHDAALIASMDTDKLLFKSSCVSPSRNNIVSRTFLVGQSHQTQIHSTSAIRLLTTTDLEHIISFRPPLSTRTNWTFLLVCVCSTWWWWWWCDVWLVCGNLVLSLFPLMCPLFFYQRSHQLISNRHLLLLSCSTHLTCCLQLKTIYNLLNCSVYQCEPTFYVFPIFIYQKKTTILLYSCQFIKCNHMSNGKHTHSHTRTQQHNYSCIHSN